MKHLERDLDKLKKDILTAGSLVEAATNQAIAALVERDAELAQEVIQGDHRIDDKEVQIEEDCLKILALHQPVAVDLRFIITVMKVNNDLERMGDLAVNIAERAAFLAAHPPLSATLEFGRMTSAVRGMLRESLDALVNLDTRLARQVCREDDVVDQINANMHVVLQQVMREDIETIERCVHILLASRHLERIADLATNIAEDVVFLVEGIIIRHHVEDYERGRGSADV